MMLFPPTREKKFLRLGDFFVKKLAWIKNCPYICASIHNKQKHRPMTQEIENNSIWVKKGFSPKTKYNVVNVSETTVYFYSCRTGTHHQYSIKNFLNKFQESQNAVQ